ncbi:MAG: TIGR03618 family F420-dependent PPOX class oxidoreductase [Streptosporangiales bacterium]|nr:TIGR03618 family F420-dependent PPOX class oxidoreductase [Streptosporangiales bacterium]
MDIERATEFLRHNHRGVLSTFRRDGRLQMSPVTATLDGAGRVIISTRETAMKVHNLRRDPRATLVMFTDAFFGEWVRVEGEAEVISQPEAMELLVDYYRRAAGEHPDWADYRVAMERERRVIVRFPIERAGPDVGG